MSRNTNISLKSVSLLIQCIGIDKLCKFVEIQFSFTILKRRARSSICDHGNLCSQQNISVGDYLYINILFSLIAD